MFLIQNRMKLILGSTLKLEAKIDRNYVFNVVGGRKRHKLLNGYNRLMSSHCKNATI